MKLIRRSVAIALAILAAPISLAQAEGPYRNYRSHAAPEQIATTQGLGCYWYRQRQYCYVEVNGQRYCREREREAFPQAPVDTILDGQPLWGPRMKLGGDRATK
jgi:hypothetical protein